MSNLKGKTPIRFLIPKHSLMRMNSPNGQLISLILSGTKRDKGSHRIWFHFALY